MPFLKKIENQAGTIGIWKLSETSEKLLSEVQLSETEKKFYESIKNERRRKEFLAVRLLLKNLTGNHSEIEYEKSGRPRLKNSSKHISISHSAELAVFFISDKNGGIDVENTCRNIAPIAKRFLSKKELEDCENSANKQLTQTIYWSAKEAIFKCTCEENIHFNNQIYIQPFDLNNEKNLYGELKIGEQLFTFDLGYFMVENNVIVYCVEL
jgi:phosphopantetheinyl transferase